MSAEISAPDSFAEGASEYHEQALFSPVPDQRREALAQIRAQSAYDPIQWAKFDLAAGIKTKEQVKEHLEKHELTADTTSPINSWIEYDSEVTEEHEPKPSTLQWMIGMGFSTPSTLSRYAHVKPMRHKADFDADIDMNARARGRQDLPAYGLDGVALPIVHVDWEIDSREYQNSQAYGEDLDAGVAKDARDALEDEEDDLFWNGWGGTIDTRDGPFSVRGVISSHGNKITGSASDFGTPDNVLDTFTAIHRQFEGQDHEHAPSPRQTGAIAFVPSEQYTEMTLGDYETSATDEPLMERLQRKFPYMTFKEAPRLESGNIVVVLNDTRYFEVVTAQGVTNTSWDVDGGFGRRSKLLASRIPWVKEQPDGINGIAHFTGA